MTVLDYRDPKFPHHSHTHESGIIAIGGRITSDTLLDAYAKGIFPWYSDDLPLWWNPDPRFVLFPSELKVSKSMRPYFNQQKFKVTYNQSFSEVIHQCGKLPRKGQAGTWLNQDLIDAFTDLNFRGYAHSVEVWNKKEELVGGLYGMALGKVFFGESMFSIESNASKFGFITLINDLESRGFGLIDCQQETMHLASLGARNVSRETFINVLAENEVVKLKQLELT
ncbi:MAG: leucyl/phenylalanyl-tRNA--protein transferase [Saprospiraceae bacterium]|nr:leucyl/phenylalanyl-tRNA--protein transferase [Saprospiraceae bacterium]